jgi:hypothetical protein
VTYEKTLEEYSRSKEVTPAAEYGSRCAGYGEKHTHMPNTAQVMSTLRKYLTPSSKSYQQSHNGLDGIRKQMNESNKTDYLLPTKKPTAVT